jgi:hypothetical protein
MKRLFIHNPFFRLVAPLVFGVVVYLLILLVSNNLNDLSEIFSNEELYVSIGLTYLSFESLRLGITIVNRFKFSSIRNHILISIGCSVVASLFVITLVLALYFKFVVGFDIDVSELLIFWIIFGFTGLLYNILFFSNDYLFKENIILLDQENKLKEKIELDFMAFRNEINPDLLYESLETLLISLHKHGEQAEEQIDLLADVYRYQLVNRKKELVKWSEEEKALKSLCSLLNYRYDQNIHLEFDLTNELENNHVVPGSFLVALDAVVRNTLISRDMPLKVRLYREEEDYVVMHHPIYDKLLPHTESIENFVRLQRSYSFFSDHPFVQVKADRENYIKFPIITVHDETITAAKA